MFGQGISLVRSLEYSIKHGVSREIVTVRSRWNTQASSTLISRFTMNNTDVVHLRETESMDTQVGWKARAETTLATRQLKRLRGMHVNPELAKSVMELTGAILVVPVFKCYRANRQKFGGREQFEARITILHLEGVNESKEFLDRMIFMEMVPMRFGSVLRHVTLNDCRRVLAALQFLAQRY